MDGECFPSAWHRESAQETRTALILLIINPTELSWRRKWQPTRVSWPGESRGQGSLAEYSPWGHKEWDVTQWLTHTGNLPVCRFPGALWYWDTHRPGAESWPAVRETPPAAPAWARQPLSPQLRPVWKVFCGVGEDSWEPLGLQGDPTSPS